MFRYSINSLLSISTIEIVTLSKAELIVKITTQLIIFSLSIYLMYKQSKKK